MSGVDQPLVSLFPALSSPGTFLQSSRLSLLQRTSVCPGLGCEAGNRLLSVLHWHAPSRWVLRARRCGEIWGGILKAWQTGRLWVAFLKQHDCVGCLCTHQTHLRKALCGFVWVHIPILLPESGHMRTTMSLGLETLSEQEKETNA